MPRVLLGANASRDLFHPEALVIAPWKSTHSILKSNAVLSLVSKNLEEGKRRRMKGFFAYCIVIVGLLGVHHSITPDMAYAHHLLGTKVEGLDVSLSNRVQGKGPLLIFYNHLDEAKIDSEDPRALLLRQRRATKGVIFNGDDFGHHPRVNKGIVNAFRRGLLSSITLQPPNWYAAEAYGYMAQYPQLELGVHLTLTSNTGHLVSPLSPISRVPSLVNNSGYFHSSILPLLFKGRAEEIKEELQLQIEDALAHGMDLTHLDCHMGWCHSMAPESETAYLDLAEAYDVPVRWMANPNEEKLRRRGLLCPTGAMLVNPVSQLIGYPSLKNAVILFLRHLQKGQIIEFILHPMAGACTWSERYRCMEYRLMFDAEVKKILDQEGIAVMGYRELRDVQRAQRRQGRGKTFSPIDF
jgi:predicted glycoside hydrolase/deacetylase ChbG (UPF0249 family)